MFRFYTPVLLLQIYCLYHAYKNRKDYFWYLLILMLPFLGAIIYLITQVFNKADIAKASDEIAAVIIPSKKVKDAQKRLDFVDSFQNRIALADAYYENADYENAVNHYQIALNGKFKNNFHETTKLIKATFLLENYEEVVSLVEKIKDHSEFANSKTEYILGLALKNLGKTDKAEKHLKVIDMRYSNYEERLVLATFYHEQNKPEKAIEILDEILAESQNMSPQNRKLYRHVVQEVRRLRTELQN